MKIKNISLFSRLCVVLCSASVHVAAQTTFTVKHPDNTLMTPYESEGASKVTFFESEARNARQQRNSPNIIMVPGLGLDGSLYTTTPDGRESWAQQFAANRYNVYVVDAPFTEASGIDSSRPSSSLSKWAVGRVYSKWGFGSSEGQPYPNTQYPVDYMDSLVASFPYYFSPSSAGQYASVALANNLEALVDQIGPSVLMVHSAAGVAGFQLLERSEDLTGLVVLEPVGCPGEDIANYENIFDGFFISVYGDFVRERGQTGRYDACKDSVDRLAEEGHDALFIDYPALGIAGNSHLFPQAYNNAALGDIVIEAIQTRL